jgi:hypothetical protein
MKKKPAIIGAFTPEAILKRKVRAHLRKLGFHKSPGGALLPPSTSKQSIRALHFEQRKAGLKAQREFVQLALANTSRDSMPPNFLNGLPV